MGRNFSKSENSNQESKNQIHENKAGTGYETGLGQGHPGNTSAWKAEILGIFSETIYTENFLITAP